MPSTRGRSPFVRGLRRLYVRWARFSQPAFGPFRAKWRRSLMLRTMTIAGLVAGLMILGAGAYLLASVSDDLYESRRYQALEDSARATLQAQRQIDASDAADSGAMQTLVNSLSNTVQNTTSSQMIYLRRQPGQAPVAGAPGGFTTNTALVDVITPELSEAVVTSDDLQYWQAVSIGDEFGTVGPGIVVVSTLNLPAGAGTYDLFIGYNLSDTEETMGFIRRTFMIAAGVIVAVIGGLVWAMSRTVFRPVRAAADTSSRLALGESEARMPLQNDEHFDELSTNFNDMADTLQARIDELDHLSVMQQRFVSDVSHELRTPLTTIHLAAEVLRSQHDQLQPAHARAVEVLGTQVDRFETLLTDLLEISRYDAGRVTIEPEPTNLVHLTQEEVDGLQPLSNSIIEVRALGGYTPIEVDARRIRRIVSNLVGNAIEHGEGNAIVVTVDSNAAAIAISVRDWGIGMSEEEVSRVFDRFWRADPSRKRTLGGTGLGLAIAREDAAVHGGLLEVWSRPGEGANFRLTLPHDDHDETFVSPLPLLPEDVEPDESDPMSSGGWLRRPYRWVRRERK